jgi:hypothetical protein
VDVIVARSLTPEEKSRFQQCLRLLHADPLPGEPENEEQRIQTRLELLRPLYPDVFELIGC